MRAHLIEEYERPDHTALRIRQNAPHFEVITEVARTRHDYGIQDGILRKMIHRSPACHVVGLIILREFQFSVARPENYGNLLSQTKKQIENDHQ
jgi:hypothetical protein